MGRQVHQIRDCYERALARDAELRGRVVVHFAIVPSGEVASACVASSTLESPWLEACMVRALQSWRFPALSRADPLGVAYPFVLSPIPAEPR